MIKAPKEVPKEMVYTVASSSTLITTMPSVMLFQISQSQAQSPGKKEGEEEGGAASYVVPPNTLVLQLKCLGPGTYPVTFTLQSAMDTRVVEVEFVVTPNLLTADLDFSCAARDVISQDIPLVNSSDKPISISAKLTGSGFSGPSSCAVPPQSTEVYALTFSPNWLGDYTGSLVLNIQNSFEGSVYTLKGVAVEPLCETHVVLEGSARVSMTHTLAVPNVLDGEMAQYQVYSDLPFVSGPDKLRVPSKGTGKLELTLQPFKSGTHHGTVTVIAQNGNYAWYTLEVKVAAPPVQEEVTVEAEVRKAVLVEMSLTNPIAEELEFAVEYRGAGIFGLDKFKVGPHETKAYELVYSPLAPGKSMGEVRPQRAIEALVGSV